LNLNYVTSVKHDINKPLIAGFIQPIEEVAWLSPIVVMPKKNGKLKICVDFRKLNTETNILILILYHFSNEVLNTVIRYEVYSFFDGY
jgi:hypothetical protein